MVNRPVVVVVLLAGLAVGACARPTTDGAESVDSTGAVATSRSPEDDPTTTTSSPTDGAPWDTPATATGTVSPTADGDTSRLACNGAGQTFPEAAIDGPVLDADDLANIPAGAAMVDAFTTGDAAVEDDAFDGAEGFVVLVDEADLVLFGGLESGEVASDYRVELVDDAWSLREWGGCTPTLVSAPDSRAARWNVAGIGDDGRRIEIAIEGGECVNEPGATRTRIASIDVVESDGRVEVVVWVQEPRPTADLCEGVGIELPGTVELDEPLGSRALVDGGSTPATTLCNGSGVPSC